MEGILEKFGKLL